MVNDDADEGGALDRLAARIQDPDDYARSRRMRQIYDARERVHVFIAQMDLPETGMAYHLGESVRLGMLVSLYIIELEPLMDDVEGFGGEAVEWLCGWSDRLGRREMNGDEQLTFRDADSATLPPSPFDSLRAFNVANRFARAAGLDLEVAQDAGDAGFGYEAILEDGPPGSGEVPAFETAVDGGDSEVGADE